MKPRPQVATFIAFHTCWLLFTIYLGRQKPVASFLDRGSNADDLSSHATKWASCASALALVAIPVLLV